jgi:vacuolar-type H+-ATPase subunit I/STV1
MKAIVFSLLFCFALGAQDWDSCASALNDLSRRARDAESEAEDADDAADEVEAAQEELRNCRASPDTFDNCESPSSDLAYARDDLDSAISDLRDELDRVNRALRDVESSCGFEFSLRRGTPSGDATRQQSTSLCSALLAATRELDRQTTRTLCLRYMTVEQCDSCLATSP